jgi:hypothetical protein
LYDLDPDSLQSFADRLLFFAGISKEPWMLEPLEEAMALFDELFPAVTDN